jgi:hypothetical protein
MRLQCTMNAHSSYKRCVTRHFARIGIFCEFRESEIYSTTNKSNIYKSEDFELCRFAFQYDDNLENWQDSGFSIWQTFTSEKLHDNQSSVRYCWQMHSEFVPCIYKNGCVWLNYGPHLIPFIPMHYLDDILLGCGFNFLVLSWFDRFDRMLFWKYLQKQHSISYYIGFAITFINQYL